jgi:plasmid replication initiation protein
MKKLKDSKKKSITLIKKSNDLIEARYMFDIWETRFFLSVLSQIHRDDTEFKVYRIKYKDVIKTFDLKSNSSYDYLRQAAKNIMDRKVAISYEVGGVTRETLYHIIRKVDYMKEGEEGKGGENHEYIDVSVESEMKPLLLQLQKNFTAYDLRNVVRLGVYPIRIYELLKQYENIGKRTLTIEQLKKMFELTHEYPRFSNFYQKIVKPAIQEINDYTDLKVTDVVRVKEERNVVGLQFFFERKNAEEIEAAHGTEAATININLFSAMEESNVEESDFTEIEDIVIENIEEKPIESEAVKEKDRLFLAYQQSVVANFGVTPTVFLHALDDKNEADIEKAIRVTEQAIKEGNVKNLAGFFMEALRQNFTNPKEEKNKLRGKTKHRVGELRAEIEALSEERERLINDKIRSLTASQPNLTQEMIERIEANPYLRIFLEGKKNKIGRTLSIEDYRQDIELRTLVKQGFFDEFKAEFVILTKALDEQILSLEKELNSFQLG